MDLVISAILLAAGESRRMGSTNKLALDIDGVPMVRRAAETLLAASLAELVVVLGHEAERIGSLLTGLPLRTVVNEAYPAGRMSSVHRGLETIDAACDGILIALADQPLLEPDDIARLLGAFRAAGQGAILLPSYRGRRGNPVLLDAAHREPILAMGPAAGGARAYIDAHPERVHHCEMDNGHVVTDLDTPEDYAALTGGGVASA
jgi:molybdenum cofactor cytidylyltransferase